jgi:site-specific recombinase XerD
MATLKFFISGKKEPAEIKIRYLNGRAIDLICGTNLFVMSANWDKKNEKIRNVISVPDRDKINFKLADLKNHILNDANISFMDGGVLNRIWLEKAVSKFFNRPSDSVKKAIELHKIYFTDFNIMWLKDKAPKYKVSSSKYMDETTIRHYTILNNLIKKFEGKDKIKFADINDVLLDKFSEFLATENYAEKTAKRMIGRVKFFCTRAESENIVLDQSYKNRVFVAKEDIEYKAPYFNELEITKIYRHDFSKNELLDNARDNLIIGLWTGLRVSDFLQRLKLDNFSGDYIEIEPEKTRNHKTFVTIPVHWMVREILAKRKGKLPSKVTDADFNKQIKTIARILKFKTEMMGGVSKIIVDEKTKQKTKRKIVKLYPKHELVTSHICRRSFATNNYGTIPNVSLMAICGWKSEEQMLDYIKMTNKEHAENLKKVWDSKLLKAN